MPDINIRGCYLTYLVVGDKGPWMTLTTGGRRGHEEFLSLAKKLADRGIRVLLHDRRNTGASDISIENVAGAQSEEQIWADDLHELLNELGALPAFIGGSSSGARLSMLYSLRHPEGTKGLCLLRVTGGPVPAAELPAQYYGQYIEAARQGGMAAVCNTEQYLERIAANPKNRDRLMAMSPDHYIDVMQGWLDHFQSGANLPVMGVNEQDLNAIKVPTMIIPGNDNIHSSKSAAIAHEMISGSQLHQLPIEDHDVKLIPFTEWAHLEDEIADVFADFILKTA